MFLALPTFALAQGNGNAMKGPPNANGYGQPMGQTTTGQPTNDQSDGSGRNMKGPPNANGYKKEPGQK
jgi:hypothetical protein